jgi:hypothetical protein
MLELRIVNARTDPERVAEFQRNLQHCYAAYEVQGAAQRVSISDGPDPEIISVHYVCAIAPSGDIVGGTRIHIRGPGHLLPMEQAMPHDSRLARALNRRQSLGLVEYAGLWALPEYRGIGLSGILSCLAVAATPTIGALVGCGFTHHHLNFWAPLGFAVDTQLGFFQYPDERYCSYVLWVEPVHMASADPEYQRVALDMREALRIARPIFWNPEVEPLSRQVMFGKPRVRMPSVTHLFG